VEKVVAQPADVASLGRICFLAELGVRQTMLRNAIQIKNVFVEKVVAESADVASLGRICSAELGVRQTMVRNAILIKNVIVGKAKVLIL